MAFKTEKDLFNMVLSSHFMQKLINHHNYQSFFLVEPKGLFGIPDLVIAYFRPPPSNGCQLKTYAFEMKLSNWKRALAQAFRYRAFANMSFVIIDRSHSKAALSHLNEFIRANIGLLSIDNLGLIQNHHEPNFDLPYSDRLVSNLKEMIVEKAQVA